MVSKFVGVVIWTVRALFILAMANPLEWNVLNLNEDVGRVELGFVNTDEILARIYVPSVASTINGLVKFTQYPPVTANTVQGVEVKEVEFKLTEHELGREATSIPISLGMKIIKYPPEGIGWLTVYLRLQVVDISFTTVDDGVTVTKLLDIDAVVAVMPDMVPVATKELSVDRQYVLTTNPELCLIDAGFLIPEIVIVKDCAGIIEAEELILDSVIEF